jgi:hypothetical protein
MRRRCRRFVSTDRQRHHDENQQCQAREPIHDASPSIFLDGIPETRRSEGAPTVLMEIVRAPRERAQEVSQKIRSAKKNEAADEINALVATDRILVLLDTSPLKPALQVCARARMILA